MQPYAWGNLDFTRFKIAVLNLHNSVNERKRIRKWTKEEVVTRYGGDKSIRIKEAEINSGKLTPYFGAPFVVFLQAIIRKV